MSAREHSHSNVDNHQKYSVSLLRVYSQARPLETRMTVPFVYIYAFRITAFLVLHRLPSCMTACILRPTFVLRVS
jgi:hypothetical protein